MRSDRNGELHTEIRDGILTRLIDEGPALVAAVVVTASSTVIGWGMYSDLADAFHASSRGAFTVMLGLVVTIVATVGYGLGRISTMNKSRAGTSPVSLALRTSADGRKVRTDSFRSANGNGEPPNGRMPFDSHPLSFESKVDRARFLSEAAQELRAPLTSMCLAARIIRKHHESTPEVVERFGETMVLEADKLGEMIDEFLDLARIESDCVDWNDEDLDPAELLHETISQIEPLAIGYGVGVSFVLEPDLSPIRADHARIKQVLTVLLGIAVREAADDVEICIQIAEANGGWVLSVGDNRHVYSHTEAHRITSWCDDATDSLDRQSDQAAHGIGLKVCREIVSRYDGRVWIEGNLADSGCVRFTVPYPTENELSRAAAAPSVADANERSANTTSHEGEPDLVSRHEAAVRALSERASHEVRDVEESQREFDTDEDSSVSAETNPEPRSGTELTAAKPATHSQISEGRSKDLSVPGTREIAGRSQSESRPRIDGTALEGAVSPKAIPNRPDTRSANVPVTRAGTSPATRPAPGSAATSGDSAKPRPAITERDTRKAEIASKPTAPAIEAKKPQNTATPGLPESRRADEIAAPKSESANPPANRAASRPVQASKPQTPQRPRTDENKTDSATAPLITPPAPRPSVPDQAARAAAKTVDDNATARTAPPGRSTTGSRPTLGHTVSDDSASPSRAPVTGMAISARRRAGNRPLLALGGPAGSTQDPNGSSVRAASDKALLELAFARDGGDDEVSKEEAEFIAQATGTTLAPYNRNARTARSVRAAGSASNRESASARGGQPSGRTERRTDGEGNRGRLDERLAKRLGID